MQIVSALMFVIMDFRERLMPGCFCQCNVR